MSSLQSRQAEIAAKRAKLAELKRQRELRQKDFSSNRQSIGDAAELAAASPLRSRTTQSREDIDSLIDKLVPDRPTSSGGSRTPARSPAKRVSAGEERESSREESQTRRQYQDVAVDTQTLGFAEFTTVYEIPVESKPEVITYSKGVQTTDPWEEDGADGEGDGVARSPSRRRRRHLSEREKELEEEEIRQRLRQEIEEELKALRLDEKAGAEKQRFPVRPLAPEEVNAVTNSADFLDFIERSSKVIERALDEEYDVLADYALQSRAQDADDDEDFTGLRSGRRIKEIASFPLSEAMGTKRMISALDFSPKFPELLCTTYTKSQTSPHTPPGLLNVWNLHLKGRPEYSLHATSDLLSCLWHPFHPSLLLGGTYSGQLCLWDTRARNTRTGEPVQKTPLTGGRTGHAHPIYSLAVVGTQNASSIISVSTDGVVCAWSTDMLTVPQEYLELKNPFYPSVYKTDDVAPTCIAFPASDPTYFLAGTEQGAIMPVHRYDRAGAKAGVDARTVYAGHAAPVTSIDFHPSRGKVDLGDLFVSAGMDWSVRVWRARPAAGTGAQQRAGASNTPSSTGTATTAQPGPNATAAAAAAAETGRATPLLDLQRDETPYAVRWSPSHPAVFGLVDGAGVLDIYDINSSTEIPVASARPSYVEKDVFGLKSLNALAWEKSQGRHVAVGGLGGVVSVFEVGAGLAGTGTGMGREEGVGVRKWVNRAGKGVL